MKLERVLWRKKGETKGKKMFEGKKSQKGLHDSVAGVSRLSGKRGRRKDSPL